MDKNLRNTQVRFKSYFKTTIVIVMISAEIRTVDSQSDLGILL